MPDLLLVFAYHYPPENSVGGARPYRFCKYLSRMGVRCRVFTAVDVISRPDLDAETVGDPFVTNPRQGMGWQLERVIRRFCLPGVTGTQWALRAAQAAKRFVENQYAGKRNDVRITILSTYPPLGTPLAAYLLQRERRYRWIADFRDPLAGNPGSGDVNAFHKFCYRRTERVFAGAADCLIANTDAAQQKLQAAYPAKAEKIHLIWNGFDPEQKLSALPLPSGQRRVYSHVGELYEGRSMAPLLYSLGRLMDGGKLDPAKFQIQQIGPVRAGCLPDASFTAVAEAKGWLRVVPDQIPQAEAQRISGQSDGLLIVQPHSAVQVPGKLFEYVQIGRPILAFILPNSPIERILRQSEVPYAAAYASGPDDALDEAVWRYFQLDSTPVKPSAWFADSFDGQKQAEQLYQLIERVHQRE
jgi:hypothetical protein